MVIDLQINKYTYENINLNAMQRQPMAWTRRTHDLKTNLNLSQD